MTTSISDLVNKIDELVKREVLPLEQPLLQHGFAAVLPALTAARRKVKAAGLWAPFLPINHGGLGLTISEYARISEALGVTPLGHYAFNCQAPDVGNMEVLITHGTDEQKARWLAPLTAGETRSCFAMTEPEHPVPAKFM